MTDVANVNRFTPYTSLNVHNNDMVKLNCTVDSDDEFPELSTIIAGGTLSPQKRGAIIREPNSNANPPEHHVSVLHGDRQRARGKQEALKVAHVNSILLSLTDRAAWSTDPSGGRSRPSVLKAVGSRSKHASPCSSVDFPKFSENLSPEDMFDFVVDGSDSSDSEKSSVAPVRLFSPPRTQIGSRGISSHHSSRASSGDFGNTRPLNEPRKPLQSDHSRECGPTKSSTRRRQHIHKAQSHSSSVAGRHDNDNEELGSVLEFSPPRVKSPSRSPPQSHVVTLPANPSKLKLPSPDKKFHIPRSPHRPSIDAFWSQEVINDWTDSYTPRKIAKPYSSRVPNTSSEDDKDFPLPRQAPRRSPSKSPSKADTEAAERRRAFNKDKYELGAAFLRELDQTIVDGQITRLAEPAGGVQLLWSKKLQSTAGRANWRREAIRSKDGEVTSTTYRHFASIELAEKVIDDEGDYEPYHQWTEQESTRSLTRLIDRLINVICHEYCHLLTFMMSNVKDNPHGKEFKTWAKKCSTAYAHRGVNVTTTHVYEISYKYIWECSKCGTAYKRHSKSIDPTRHSCGKCHEKLLQVKPTPRGNGKGISDYQKFVKEHFARLKRERPEMNMGEVMTALGREYREAREKGIGDMVLQVDEGPKVGRDENAGLEAVVRKLDLLAMGTDGERSNL
ncbi:MAG: hypothetical protein Q9198_005999 [Flavoplaca austrocitrina]